MSKKKTLTCDVLIVGAGPAGLCFARALQQSGLKVLMVEKQSATMLASPAPDGRDIALTHLSEKLLSDLSIWQRISDDEKSPIREARVLDGTSPRFLQFSSQQTGKPKLGTLVPNHLIRKAAYEAVCDSKTVTLLDGVELRDISTQDSHATAQLANGQAIEAKVAVAADSRFSQARRLMGIATSMRDFGRSVIVCRMRHERPHHEIAYECFHYGRTLAVLPLKGNVSSVVVTLPNAETGQVMQQASAVFCRAVAERFAHRLGKMQMVGERHIYPLVAVYADAFHKPRFALLGDAAVGMHPVTAHGFNLGLRGAATLAEEIKQSLALGLDIGHLNSLETYSRTHRQASLPIYLGTNLLVGLYTDERRAAKLARSAVLRLGNIIAPANRLITAQLTEIPR